MPNPPEPTPRCIRCGGAFTCGAQQAQCWCQELPPLDLSTLPAQWQGGCFCPACLRQLITEQHAQHQHHAAGTTANPARPKN